MSHYQIVEILQTLCQEVGTPRALSAFLLSKHGEYTQLQQLRTDSEHYLDAHSYLLDASVTDFLRKAELPSNVDKDAVALSTFYDCEKQCAATNLRLERYLPENRCYTYQRVACFDEFIISVRKDIKSWLGECPSELVPIFSNGATLSDRHGSTTIPDKFSSAPTFYPTTFTWMYPMLTSSWGRYISRRQELIPKRANKFFTVPKDASKNRGCCKEASVNVTLQLSAARSLRRGLRRIGINLETGQDLHRELAREGSVHGWLATIDCSNASDTVATNCVKSLLPRDWFLLLNDLRAEYTELPNGRTVRLEKFSSMGNGFTFELETLIFAAVGRAACRFSGCDQSLVSAFGDDLIVPSEAVNLVKLFFSFLGFTINAKKSFFQGPFRESCGGDFFQGIDVRPSQVKTLPSNPLEWFTVHNMLVRLLRKGVPCVRALRQVRTNIPTRLRSFYGPAHLGDAVLHSDSNWETKKNRFGSTLVRGITPVQKVWPIERWCDDVQLATCTLVGTKVTMGSDPGYLVTWLHAELTSRWLPEGAYEA